MKLQHHAKTAYEQEPISMPIVGVGECKNLQRCRNFLTDLANGYCVKCWDRGLDNYKKPENIKEPINLEVKKSRKMVISSGGTKLII